MSLATLCGVFFGRRKHVRLLGVLGLALLLSVGTLITGCSNGGSNKSTTAPTLAPGTYSVTVTATPGGGKHCKRADDHGERDRQLVAVVMQ